MGWLSNALKFELSRTKDIFKGIKDDPKRLLLGVDGPSTAAWNALLGRDDKPIVGTLGGPTEQNYANAEARGIDTGPGRAMNTVAQYVAALYGGQALGGLAGGGAGASGSATSAGADLAQYAKFGQAAADQASRLMQPGPAPVAAPPPASRPSQQVQLARTGLSSGGPGPVMATPQQRRMLAHALRSGGRVA
jgi:hypothetical protein